MTSPRCRPLAHHAEIVSLRRKQLPAKTSFRSLDRVRDGRAVDDLEPGPQPGCCTAWASSATAWRIWVLAGDRILPSPISFIDLALQLHKLLLCLLTLALLALLEGLGEILGLMQQVLCLVASAALLPGGGDHRGQVGQRCPHPGLGRRRRRSWERLDRGLAGWRVWWWARPAPARPGYQHRLATATPPPAPARSPAPPPAAPSGGHTDRWAAARTVRAAITPVAACQPLPAASERVVGAVPGQHAPERGLHVGGALVALAGLLGQGGQHHRVQPRDRPAGCARRAAGAARSRAGLVIAT
jgi:hypothetical protein